MKTKLIWIGDEVNPLPLLGALLVLNAGIVMGAGGEAAPGMPNPFFVAHQEPREGWPGGQQGVAELVKGLGYDGMGKLWLDDLPDVLKAFDAVGLKLSQIYLNVDLSLNHIPEVQMGGAAYDPRLKQTLPLLKGRGVQLVLGFYGFKASDPVIEARAMKIVREIADLASTAGARVLLSNTDGYPPKITIDDMISLADKVDKPNVGVMFDLFDYLVIRRDHDYRPLLKRAIPRLMAVGVVGTDEFPVSTNEFYLKPLGRGSFDMFAFLKTLNELGYKGPIVLETQGIGGDRRAVLKESIEAWRKYSARLADR